LYTVVVFVFDFCVLDRRRVFDSDDKRRSIKEIDMLVVFTRAMLCREH